jgi:hypothetical protein
MVAIGSHCRYALSVAALPAFLPGALPMWSVWFYTPSGGRKFIDRFNTRNKAEAYRRRLGRLIGAPQDVIVCFDPN